MASGSNIERSPHYGALQDMVDGLFAGASADDTVRRLDAVIAAEAADLPDDLMEVVRLLPPGSYTRQRLCDQVNSALGGHAWGQVCTARWSRAAPSRSAPLLPHARISEVPVMPFVIFEWK